MVKTICATTYSICNTLSLCAASFFYAYAVSLAEILKEHCNERFKREKETRTHQNTQKDELSDWLLCLTTNTTHIITFTTLRYNCTLCGNNIT